MPWYDEIPRPQFLALPQVETGDSWYTVLQLPQEIYAICEPRHFQEVISFLILGKSGALLLDTGMGLHPIRPVVERLTDLPLTVVNTHSHFDHVGENWEFPFAWGWARSDSQFRAQMGWKPKAGDENFLPQAFLEPVPGAVDYRQKPYVLKALADGQRFDLGGRVWQVLHTPGHSADSIMLVCEEEQLLCTGDTLYPGTLYAQKDPAAYGSTLQTLAARYAGCTLLCSHNEPLRSGDLLDRAAKAFSAMLSGETDASPAEDGLWLHSWQGIRILSSISG